MTTTNDPREQSLPKWAQLLINHLRTEKIRCTEDMAKEIAQLRPTVTRLTNRLDAMEEIMQCLIRGGHPESRMIHDIVGSYGMNIVTSDDL